MKIKISAIFLAMMLCVFALTGCGSTDSEQSAAESESAASAASSESESAAASESAASGEISGVANPWVDTTKEEMEQTVGLSFNEPENASDIAYSTSDEGIAQMTYTDENGLEICVRAKLTGSAEDISGMYFDWSSEEDCTVDYCEGKLMQASDGDQTVEVCTWFDAVPGISYSVSTEASDLDGFDLTAVAESVFQPAQGESDGDDAVSVYGSYTCDYDGSTLTIGEDGSVDIELYRLTSLLGTATGPVDGIMTFNVKDANDGDMTLEFNTATGVLTATDSSWDLLANGINYTFTPDGAE